MCESDVINAALDNSRSSKLKCENVWNVFRCEWVVMGDGEERWQTHKSTTYTIIYIHRHMQTCTLNHSLTRTHTQHNTQWHSPHTDSSQESATTTSTTLLLVNLEASFTGVTWLRRCHSPTNQYHSESSGPTAGVCSCACMRACAWACVCVCKCVSCWKLQQLDSTLLTCLPDSNYMGRDVVRLLLTSTTNEVKHRQIGKDKGSQGDRTDR